MPARRPRTPARAARLLAILAPSLGAEPPPAAVAADPPATWAAHPIEPKARTTGTAYTVGRGTWSLGLVEQELGLLDNLDVGVNTPLWVLGVPNGHAKVTAIQTRRLDVALDGGVYGTGLARFGVPNGQLLVTPVGFTASGLVSRRLSVHGGLGWTIASADGRLTPAQIADGIRAATGADVTKELHEALGGEGGVYAGANLTLFQTRLSADWRFNRRDSLVFTSNTWVWMSGLAAAGVGLDAGGGTEVEVGASARVRVPLAETLPSLTTLAWQFDWPRVNLRLGIPLSLSNPFAWFQAFDLKVLLGPQRTAHARSVADAKAAQAPEPVAADTGAADPADTGAAPSPDTGTADPPDTGAAPEDSVGQDPGVGGRAEEAP